MQVDALVIAGGSKTNLYETNKVAKEALIPIGQKVMVEYVVEALETTPNIKNIVVVGPISELKKVFAQKPNILLAAEGDSAIESGINGLKVLKPKGRVLVLTGDIPLISPRAIMGFLEACKESDIDLFYPIVPKEINEKMFPNAERTYVRLKDGTFTGGNILLLNPEIAEKCAQMGQQLVEYRKSPIKLSSLIGWWFIVKLISRRLTLEEIEEKFSNMLGIKGKAIVIPYPEIGMDVDKPSDLELVKGVIN